MMRTIHFATSLLVISAIATDIELQDHHSADFVLAEVNAQLEAECPHHDNHCGCGYHSNCGCHDHCRCDCSCDSSSTTTVTETSGPDDCYKDLNPENLTQ